MSKWDDMYRCPKCRPSGDESRCATCRDENGKRVKHRERIASVERIATGTVHYHLECECGQRWPISVMVEPALADVLVAARSRP
jgi:hypothetical protein